MCLDNKLVASRLMCHRCTKQSIQNVVVAASNTVYFAASDNSTVSLHKEETQGRGYVTVVKRESCWHICFCLPNMNHQELFLLKWNVTIVLADLINLMLKSR